MGAPSSARAGNSAEFAFACPPRAAIQSNAHRLLASAQAVSRPDTHAPGRDPEGVRPWSDRTAKWLARRDVGRPPVATDRRFEALPGPIERGTVPAESHGGSYPRATEPRVEKLHRNSWHPRRPFGQDHGACRLGYPLRQRCRLCVPHRLVWVCSTDRRAREARRDRSSPVESRDGANACSGSDGSRNVIAL